MTNESGDKLQKRLQLILTIIAAITALAGAFITYKLSPIASDVSVLKVEVKAISDDYARKSTMETGFNHIEISLHEIDDKLLRMEDKLDAIK